LARPRARVRNRLAACIGRAPRAADTNSDYSDARPDDADRFRKRAEEARENAARACSPLDAEAWLRVAEEWLKLAASAEKPDRK